jgi:AraC-like DNA-binding protein
MKSLMPLRYVRKKQLGENRFSLVITLNQAPFKVIDSEDNQTIFLDHPTKAMILSPHVEVSVDVPIGDKIYLIVIFLDDQWINQNLTDQHNEIKIRDLLNLNRPAVLYQQVETNHMMLIKQIIEAGTSRIIKLSAFIGLISSLFTRFIDKEENQKRKLKKDDADSIIQVCHQIEKEIDAMPTLSVLSKQAGMSLSKFKYAFKYVTGQTPYQYHLKYKMNKAKELLVKTEKSVSEIGYICGYSNLSHFSRVFKKFHGVLPSEI